MYILHSPTPLFITLCCMYVFLHLSYMCYPNIHAGLHYSHILLAYTFNCHLKVSVS